MLSRRLVALILFAALVLVAMVALRHRGADDVGGGGPIAAAGSGVVDAASSPPTPGGPSATPSTAGPAAGASPAAAPSPVVGDAERLAAVRTLKRFCDLVDDGDRRAALRLVAGPWVWPRRELAAISRLRLVSARVQAVRVAGDVVFLARLRARLHAASPLHDGVNTLFITLGRDGTTGGWLITAVTSSP